MYVFVVVCAVTEIHLKQNYRIFTVVNFWLME